MTCDPLVWLCLLLAACSSVWGQKYEGETCATGPDSFGECKRISSCDSARVDIQNGKRPEICSYERDVPIVCCADSSIVSSPVSSGPATQWPSEIAAAPRPTLRPTQRPIQRPTQRPTQRPVQQPTPPPPMAVASQSEVATTRKPGRPQWWQIPASIDYLTTTPLPDTIISGSS